MWGSVLFNFSKRREFVKGVWVAVSKRETLREVLKGVLAIATAMYLSYLDPMGLSSAMDERSVVAFKKIMSPFFPVKGHEDVSILLIDDLAIDNAKAAADRYGNEGYMSFPPSMTDYTRLLQQLMFYRPKAVFFDLLLLDERGDKIDNILFYDAIEELQRLGTQVYFANPRLHYASAVFGEGEVTCQKNSLQLFGKLEEVSNALPFVNYQGFSHYYPLRAYSACAEGMSFSPALLVYNQIYNLGENKFASTAFEDPLSIEWGNGTSRFNFKRHGSAATDDCGETPTQFWEKFWRSLKFFWGVVFQKYDTEVDRSTCYFHSFLSVKEFSDLYQEYGNRADNPLDSFAREKIIFVGADLAGIPDLHETPTIGKIPGVAVHAMALGNLIAMGDDYLRPPEELIFGVDGATVFEGLFTFLFLVLEILCMKFVVKRYASSLWKMSLCALGVIVCTLVMLIISVLSFYWITNFEPVNWLGILFLALTFIGFFLLNGLKIFFGVSVEDETT